MPGVAKPLARLTFSEGEDGADDADDCAPTFSGAIGFRPGGTGRAR